MKRLTAPNIHMKACLVKFDLSTASSSRPFLCYLAIQDVFAILAFSFLPNNKIRFTSSKSREHKA